MYRIVNWSENFENNRSRELKKLDWVPIPNKLGGDGYTELLDHENGAAHYGAWCAILLLASKCEIRGTLSRDGARPHDMRSIARITRVPVTVIEEVIPRLIHIGWLEIVDAQADEITAVTQIPQDDATIPQDDAEERLRKGKERKGIEQKRNEQQEIINSRDLSLGRKAKAVFELTPDELDTAVDLAIEYKQHIECKSTSAALTLLRVAALKLRTLSEDQIARGFDSCKRKRCRDPAYLTASIKGIAEADRTPVSFESIVIPQSRVQEVLRA